MASLNTIYIEALPDAEAQYERLVRVCCEQFSGDPDGLKYCIFLAQLAEDALVAQLQAFILSQIDACCTAPQ